MPRLRPRDGLHCESQDRWRGHTQSGEGEGPAHTIVFLTIKPVAENIFVVFHTGVMEL